MGQADVRTSLVIMAAGLGSRFGQGIKQLAKFGPHGQIIIDYSVHDALRAGFDRVIFVIRKDLEKDFHEVIGSRIASAADTAYAFQAMDDLPEGFAVPEGRKKPWGTGQAVLACRELIREPFCVINADDYYGAEPFRKIHDWLVRTASEARSEGPEPVCMAGFRLCNTLSENGGVTRGICRVDPDGSLTGIDETKQIVRLPDGAGVREEDGTIRRLDPDSLVSMNMWGFMPGFMDILKQGFSDFLRQKSGTEALTKEEYLLPVIVDGLLGRGEAGVEVLPTSEHWFGVTYQEDIPLVREKISALVRDGIYPEHLNGL